MTFCLLSSSECSAWGWRKRRSTRESQKVGALPCVCACQQSVALCGFSFVEWMYPSGGGEENVESAALGILILWTTWCVWWKGGGGGSGGRVRGKGEGKGQEGGKGS